MQQSPSTPMETQLKLKKAMGFSECLQNNVDLSCLPFAYQNLKTKKPLRISTPKWLFYMVGPDVTIL